MHYRRWRMHGDPLVTTQRSPGEAWAFYEAHVLEPSDGCRDWPFNHDNHGYGAIRIPHVGNAKVHILTCEAWNGPRPFRWYQAAHSCGRGHLGCWAGEHLSWKSRHENMQEAAQKHDRLKQGEVHHWSKLSAADVATIRERYANGSITQRELGIEYGVAQPTISDILRGKNWKR